MSAIGKSTLSCLHKQIEVLAISIMLIYPTIRKYRLA